MGRSAHLIGRIAATIDLPAPSGCARLTFSRRASAVLGLAWLVLGTYLQGARGSHPETNAWSVLYIEDASVFLPEALTHDFPGELMRAFPDYLVVVQRAIAALGSLFPIADAAFVYAIASAALASACSLYVYARSAAVLRPVWARLLLALLVVLAPVTGQEIMLTVADVHWYLLFTAFWVFVGDFATRRAAALGGTLACLAALSTPLCALYMPLALWQARRGWRERAVAAAFLAGVAAQVWSQYENARTDPSDALGVDDLVRIYPVRVVAAAVVGDQRLLGLWQTLHWWVAILSTALIATILVYGLLRVDWRTRGFVVVCGAYSASLFAAQLLVRGQSELLPVWPDLRVDGGSRYMYAPILLLLTAVLACLSNARHPGAQRWARPSRVVPWLTCAAVLALVATNYPVDSERVHDLGWRHHLAVEGIPACRHGEVDAEINGGGPHVAVIPCDIVRAEQSSWRVEWLNPLP